jgi:heme-degrading monooxygenase HmoA
MIKTPQPPYYAVIFSAQTSEQNDGVEYSSMSDELRKQAELIDGFIGIESAGEGREITVSYWKDLESIDQWRKNSLHIQAKNWGKEKGFDWYQSRICKVEREY